MNIHQVDISDYIDILDNSHQLHSWETSGGATVHIVEYLGNDLLILGERASGRALIIDANDIECNSPTNPVIARLPSIDQHLS